MRGILPYESPCYPCEYNRYAVDEEDWSCIYDECDRPKDGICWIEEWMKETENK